MKIFTRREQDCVKLCPLLRCSHISEILQAKRSVVNNGEMYETQFTQIYHFLMDKLFCWSKWEIPDHVDSC